MLLTGFDDGGSAHVPTLDEVHEEYERTGQGVDIYRDIRVYVCKWINEIPDWRGREDIDAVLLHAWLVGCVKAGLRSQQDANKEIKAWETKRKKRKPSRPVADKARNVTKLKKAAEPKRNVTPPVKPKSNEPKKDKPVCLECATPLAWDGWGRKPRYCNDSCKMKAYRKRKALRKSSGLQE